jgi:hypothetical protein
MDSAEPYAVSISGSVYDELLKLARAARDRGDGEPF